MGNTTSSMKYNTYPEYKHSGVEWLGEIPAHWGIIPLKYLAKLNPKKSIINASFFKEKCSFLPMEKLKTDSLILDEERRVIDVYNGYTYFEDGDVLMAKVTPCFENKNIAIAEGLSNGLGFGSSEIYVLRTNKMIKNRFLFYRLQEDSFMDIATSAMTGAGGLKRVPSEVVNSYCIALPQFDEQEKVADFLDYETAKIDALLEQQKQLVILLKEKRQVEVSLLVTKGLHSQATLKNSGVEWLGNIPAHWRVTKIKYVVSLFDQGWSPQCESRQAENNEYGVLKVGCVNNGVFNHVENKALPDNLKFIKHYIVKEGDLLISRANTKELVGSAAVVDRNYGNLLLCDKLYRLRFTDGILPELISIYLSIFPVRKQIELQASGASHSMQNIGQETIKNLPCLVIPLHEANELLLAIKKCMQRYDFIIDKAEQQIQLLTERRAALISAAVTGKIDVRQWQAPTSQLCHATQETSL